MPGRSRRALLLLATALASAACNLIFGIQGGEPATGATGGGSTSSSASTSSATSSTSSTSSTTSTGGMSSCGMDAGMPTGKGYHLVTTIDNDYEEATAGAFDAKTGDLVVAGVFRGPQVSFSSQPVPHSSTPGGDNAFVVRFDAKGNHLWSQGFGGDRDIIPRAMAIDATGAIWITGGFTGTVKLGSQTYTALNLDQDGYSDVFVVKLDPGGNVLWSLAYISYYIQEGLSLATDSAGNAYLAGIGWDHYAIGGASIGDDSAWTTFVAKLDPGGNTLWTKAYSGHDADLTFDYGPHHEVAVAVDKDDVPVVAGDFTNQVFFGNFNAASHGGADAFVVKLDPATGDVSWLSTLNGPAGGSEGDQWCTAVTTDPCSGDIFIAGGFKSAITLGSDTIPVKAGDPADADLFVARLDTKDGHLIWGKAFGDAGWQQAWALRVDRAGDLLLGGFFVNAPGAMGVDFGLASGPLMPAALDAGPGSNDFDAYLVKLDGSGQALWGKRFGNTTVEFANDVAVDAAGHVGLVGSYYGSLPSIDGLSSPTSDYFDAFVYWFEP